MELVSLNFTADGLGQRLAEGHDAGILIGRGMLLDVVLDFLLQRVVAGLALDKDD